jgi:phosphoglycerate dehydrogenase-like enzyme
MNVTAHPPPKMKRPADTKIVISARLRFSLWRVPEDLVNRIRNRWPEMKVVHLPNHDLLDAELPDTDIFVGYLLRSEQLQMAARLAWLHSISAGVSQLMYPELRKSGIVVTNASGVHAPPMAEHVVGLVIAMSRDFLDAMRYQARRQWAQQEIWDGPARPREIGGQVALLVGFGAVGRAIAERLIALGMRVHAVTRSGTADPGLAKRVFSAAQLDVALPEADFVILAAPETAETRHMIGARQIAAMKPSAFLINVARGSLIDETALVAALERRAIAGAALDVAAQEPLPPDSPLWPLENVFITPHVSGVSERLWPRETELLLDNLERWFTARSLRNRVDLAREY